MFQFSLASFGIGSAKVDTRIEQNRVRAGDYLRGTVYVFGGNSSQTIDSIYLYIVTQYSKGEKIQNHIFSEYHLANSFVIEPDQKKEIPFKIRVPIDMPMSCGRYPIYLKTGLDIQMAVDPTDQDRFEVLPIPVVSQVLKYIEDAGFILHSVVNQYAREGDRPHPFIQNFHFRPDGRYRGYIDYLNVFFEVQPEDIYVDMEIIRDQSALYTNFYWNFDQPKETFSINGERYDKDPMIGIQEYISKGQ